MSLILEALRKSEAERRRGQVPDLHAELPPAVQPARDAPPAWLWLALLAIGVATAWLARGLWPAPPPTAAARAETVPTAPRTIAPAGSPIGHAGVAGLTSSDPVAAAAKPSMPVTASPAAVTTVAVTTAGPTTAPRAAPVEVTPPIDATARQVAPVGPEAASPLASRPRQTPRSEPAVATSRDAVVANAPAPPAAAAPLPAPPLPAAAAASSAAMPTVALATAPAGNAARTRLADLAATERRELPPLKISMHMWNSVATQRFAIIDGNRVTEGSRIGEAVVDEITRDGVVLAWQGRRLELPIR